jgi:hypothetical protein
MNELEEALAPLAPIRGVVPREDGVIRDSYGTEYIRDEGNGMLHRVSPKAPRGRALIAEQP